MGSKPVQAQHSNCPAGSAPTGSDGRAGERPAARTPAVGQGNGWERTPDEAGHVPGAPPGFEPSAKLARLRSERRQTSMRRPQAEPIPAGGSRQANVRPDGQRALEVVETLHRSTVPQQHNAGSCLFGVRQDQGKIEGRSSAGTKPCCRA
jgi:hypothetical protein